MITRFKISPEWQIDSLTQNRTISNLILFLPCNPIIVTQNTCFQIASSVARIFLSNLIGHFPGCLMSLCQSESSRKTSHMKMCSTGSYTFIFM